MLCQWGINVTLDIYTLNTYILVMIDILIKRGKVVALSNGLGRGFNIDLYIKDGCDIAINDGIILDVAKDIMEDSERVIDANGNVVMPGFIDAHTHALFGGTRVDEFEMKIKGLTYKDIMHKGGGILNTVKKTRSLTEDDMIDILKKNLKRMSETGTTTVEVKSGYGLDLKTEISMLNAMRKFREDFIDIVPTYMGAHEFPPGKSRQKYINEVIEEHLPLVANNNLAEFCDVFCEDGVYGKEEARRILTKAKELKLGLKVHADELKESGGAELAGEIGSISAEHLIYPSDKGLELMSKSEVIAVMLPATSFILSSDKPPVSRLRENGIPMALGSDFNPGSSPVYSMPLVLGFACYHYGMSVEEAIAGSTINAAYALNRADRVGSIEKGKMADLLILDYKDIRELPYWLGSNPVKVSLKRGRICFERESC